MDSCWLLISSRKKCFMMWRNFFRLKKFFLVKKNFMVWRNIFRVKKVFLVQKNFFWRSKKNFFLVQKIFFWKSKKEKYLVIKFYTKFFFWIKMYSSESEESDNDTKRLNFNEFLYARHHKYEWKKDLPCTNSIVW